MRASHPRRPGRRPCGGRLLRTVRRKLRGVRPPWSILAVFPAAAGLALTLIVLDPHGATEHRPPNVRSQHQVRASHGSGHRFGAGCHTRTDGSQVVASCHNPYPVTDHVRLHIECARWWDIDTDAAPVAAEPATTVRLTGRCWKEIASVWVSHHR